MPKEFNPKEWRKHKHGKSKYLDYLYRELNEHDITFDDMLKLTGISKDILLRAEPGRHGFSKKDKDQKPFDTDILRKLFFAFPFLDRTKFLVKDNEHDYLNDTKYFTTNDWENIAEYQPDLNPLVNAIRFSHDKNNNQKIIDAYKQIASYYRDAKKHILVFELTFKGSNKVPGQLTAYQEAQVHIFEAIQEVLHHHKYDKDGNKDFKYTRIFSLSKSEKYFPKNVKEPDQLKTALAVETAPETFLHIENCLNDYSEFCEFYVTGASRFRQHCLIDNNWFLCEDYILIDEVNIPDCLYIDDLSQNKKMREIVGSFTRHIDQLLYKYPLEKGNIEKYMNKAYNHLEEKINKMNNIIGEMNAAKNQKYDYFRESEIPQHAKDLIDFISKEKEKKNFISDKILSAIITKAIKLGVTIKQVQKKT